jgi:hypothetical protein
MAALDFPVLNQYLLTRLEQQQREQDPAYKLNRELQQTQLEEARERMKQMLEGMARTQQYREFVKTHASPAIEGILPHEKELLGVTSQYGDPEEYVKRYTEIAEVARRRKGIGQALQYIDPATGRVNRPLDPAFVSANPEAAEALLPYMQVPPAVQAAKISGEYGLQEAGIHEAGAEARQVAGDKRTALINLRMAIAAKTKEEVTAQRDWAIRTSPSRQAEAMGILGQYGESSWPDRGWQEVYEDIRSGKDVSAGPLALEAADDLEFKVLYPTYAEYLNTILVQSPEVQLNIQLAARQAQEAGLSGPELDALLEGVPGNQSGVNPPTPPKDFPALNMGEWR